MQKKLFLPRNITYQNKRRFIMPEVSAFKIFLKIISSAKKGDFFDSLEAASDFIDYFIEEKGLSFEKIFKKAVLTTFDSQKEFLEQYTGSDGEVEILVDDFIKAVKSSQLSFNQSELLRISEEEFVDKLRIALKDNFLIGGHMLDDHDLQSLLNNFIRNLRAELINIILEEPVQFNQLLLSYNQDHQNALKEVNKLLISQQNEFQELKTILITLQTVQGSNTETINEIYAAVKRTDMTFFELVQKLKVELNAEDGYKNRGIKKYFEEMNRRLLEKIKDRGEISFLKFISAVLLPLDEEFKPGEIDYNFYYYPIKKIIRILILISTKYPELDLEYSTGQPFKVAEERNICYLHTENDKNMEAAVIDYLTYDYPFLMTKIDCFIINQAKKKSCVNLKNGAELDISQIINKITEVIVYAPENRPILDLEDYHNYTCHCGSCFNAYSITNRSDLDNKLSLLLEGESHDS
jgi:hypothetical protein